MKTALRPAISPFLKAVDRYLASASIVALVMAASSLAVAATVTASNGDLSDAPWASVDGYFVGMSKERAMHIGLVACETIGGDVTCMPAHPFAFTAVPPKKTALAFEVKSSRLKQIQISFSKEAFVPLEKELSARYGASDVSNDDSCARAFTWDHRSDYVITLCEHGGAWGSSYVTYEHFAGRGKSLAAAAKIEARKRDGAAGFNSKESAK